MKVSELKPHTVFKEEGHRNKAWRVDEQRHIIELDYHCVDCIESYDMDIITPEGAVWVDEMFGQDFRLLNIPTEQIDLGVTYQDPQRIVACSDNQVIVGVSYKTKLEEVIELWPDDATSYIHINIYEWDIEYLTTWRMMASHKHYEMSPEGRVRNARTHQEVKARWRSGIMTFQLNSGRLNTTRSANKMYRETYPEMPQPLYDGQEKLR